MQSRFRSRPLTFLSLLTAVILTLAAPARAVEVERVVTEGGIEAWLVRDHSNPITTVKFAFRGGGALDPAEKQGLSNLVAATLDEGAGDMDSSAFQKALDDRSITLSFQESLDSFRGTLRTLNRYRDDAFEYLRLALTEPRFDDAAVERMRAQVLSRIGQDRESPSRRASRLMFETAFQGHPYARSDDGTLESVPNITTEDLRRFVKERLAQDNLIVGVVGDITPDELRAYLERTFGTLPAKASPWKTPEVTPNLQGGVRIIDMDVAQSSIQFAQPGIRRDDPDFYTAYVLNYVLGGGGFVSRLYSEVREKRGLAYSVYSYLMPLDSAAMIAGGAGTANARVADTIATVKEAWRRFAAEGPSADELNDAKTYLTGAFPLRFTSSETIADMLVGMQDDNLGIDYIEKRNSYIDAVTLDGARRLAGELFQPDKLTFFIAGRPVGVTASE